MAGSGQGDGVGVQVRGCGADAAHQGHDGAQMLSATLHLHGDGGNGLAAHDPQVHAGRQQGIQIAGGLPAEEGLPAFRLDGLQPYHHRILQGKAADELPLQLRILFQGIMDPDFHDADHHFHEGDPVVQ